ncbi:MAG: ATP-binding cassette domain-containing protein [Crocinitomicaceae bacterium]
METNEPKVIKIHKGKIYQQTAMVLENVDFELGEKEFVYLIGKTGTGKSSFLKMLYGEVNLQDGEGSVAGFNLRKLRRKEIPMLRRKLGIVFQDFQLLTDRSVKDNLFFVMRATGWVDKKQMEARALEVMKLVGMESKLNAKAYALSGGEQQRVSIARALVNKPKLILADEPTGNLDSETSEEIMLLLKAVANEEKSAVIMATHDMTMVEKFPGRVIRVENGGIREVQSIDRFDPFTPFSAH